MSMKPNIISEAELAKNSVMNSPLDDDTKRNLMTLITKSAMATNGISHEEKVQALTECMAAMAAALGSYMSKSDSRLSKLENLYSTEHPSNRLDAIKKFEHDLHDVEEYRNMVGIKPHIVVKGENLVDNINKHINDDDDKKTTKQEDTDNSLVNMLIHKGIKILEKPYIWIFAAVAVCSPHAANVLQTIINAFAK